MKKLIFTVAYLFFTLSTLPVTADVNDPVAHWKLDEPNGTIAYDSAGDNDGTVHGATWTGGVIDGALDFDGSGDYVTINDSESMRSIDGNTAEYTISLWVRTTQSGAAKWNQKTIFDRRLTGGASGENDWVAHIYLNENDAASFFIRDRVGGSDVTLELNDNLVINNDDWHHIAAVRKATDYVRLYVDGDLRQSGSTTANPATTEITTIGVRRNNTGGRDGYFNGKIDDVRIYNRALSAEEVEELYQQGSSLIAHWKLDEPNGTIAYDSAGDNDGTVYGAAWTGGMIDGALDFDGSGDYVEIANEENFDFGSDDDFSICAWIKTTATSDRRRIVNKSESGHTGIELFMDPPGIVKFRLKENPDPCAAARTIIETTTLVNDGRWHFIAGVADRDGDLQLYHNGSLEGADSLALVGNINNDIPLAIGRSMDYDGQYFDGVIDDVRIYNKVLSPEEIGLLYQEGTSGTKAYDPNPHNGATGVDTELVLSWSPGKIADSHQLYFDATYEDVNDGVPSSPSYVFDFDVNHWSPGSSHLRYGTTYYWRVDEVNLPDVWKGDVWSFQIGWPAIGLSQTHFEFSASNGGPNPDNQVLSISNSGIGTLNWKASSDCNWLSVEPNSGSVTDGIDDVNLIVDISGLGGGVYECSLTISEPNASNNPQTVDVTLAITDNDGILHVPSEYWTIQAAVDAAFEGETVLVADGIYKGPGNRNIEFLGKKITVRSENGPNNCIVDCNGHGNGFNFYNAEDANSILEGFTIMDGDDVHSGIGIYCSGGSRAGNVSPTIFDCIITANLGIGILCEGESKPLISDCVITGNEESGIRCHSSPTVADCVITDSEGSGIHCDYGSPTVTDCVITGNEGSGIRCDYGSPTVADCVITGNIGSGIHCEGSSPIVTGCVITGNEGYGRSADYGGGISVFSGLCLVYNSVISGNNANENGGGICCENGGSIEITSSVITGNSAGVEGGGIHFWPDGSLKVTNSTIAHNSAEEGGGIYCADVSAEIESCIIWGNEGYGRSGQCAQICYTSDVPQVWYSCIQDDNHDDTNIPFGEEQLNIDDDPCFVAPGHWDSNNWISGDYHLRSISPCIETGNPYFTCDTNDVDIDGQPRLMGRFVDMGADEFEISAIIVITKPQAGDIWAAGSTHEITWDSYDFDANGTLDIYYSINNGADMVMIGNTSDTGSYIWNLPGGVDSNRCLVTIEPNDSDPGFVCINSSLFTIKPDSTGPPVASTWKSLSGDYDRAGLSQFYGPELGCFEWKFQTDDRISASPSIGAYGRIHISCEDGKLYTLDPNGQLLWTYNVGSPLLSSPSVGPDGSVFVGAQNGKLYAIDIDGNLRWTHTTGGFISSSPAVSPDGHIYACSQDGKLYALGQDGSELWTFETAGPGVASGSILASPAIASDGTVYIAGLYDPNLYALNSADGSVKWKCTFTDPCDPESPKLWSHASPVVAPDGTIYQTLLNNPIRKIGSPPYDPDEGFWYESKLYAINPIDGSVLWATNMTQTATEREEEHPYPPEPNYWFEPYHTTDTSPYPPYPPYPAYPQTLTYLGRDARRYYRVDNDGWSEPVLAPDNTIYTSFCDQYIRTVDPNGTIKGVTSLGLVGGFTMTVGSDGFIYAASDDGYLYIVDSDGQQVSFFKGNGKLSFPVITADGIMIVTDDENTIWAVDDDSCLDVHRDGIINNIDFATLAADWLECTDPGPPCFYEGDPMYLRGDINKDYYVDFADVEELVNSWLIEE